MIDPAPAVARQAVRLLASNGLLPQDGKAGGGEPGRGALRFYTSGPVEGLSGRLLPLLGETGPVEPIYWRGYTIQQRAKL